jgi:hypothetical protein
MFLLWGTTLSYSSGLSEIEYRELPNGGRLLQKEFTGSPSTAVSVYFALPVVWETPETDGLRHLFEHLMMRRLANADRALESVGGYSRAETGRDFVRVNFSVPAGKESLIVEALRALTSGTEFAEEVLETERRILSKEEVFREPGSRDWDRMWKEAYGTSGISAFGRWAELPEDTPQLLNRIESQLFSPEKVTVVIAAGENNSLEINQFESWLNSLHTPASPPMEARPNSDRKTLSSGGWWGITLPSITTEEGRALLLFAFGLSGETGAQMVYTPTTQPAMAFVESNPSVGVWLSNLQTPDRAQRDGLLSQLYQTGRRSFISWISSSLIDPAAFTNVLGHFVATGVEPEAVFEMSNGDVVPFSVFRRTVDQWQE